MTKFTDTKGWRSKETIISSSDVEEEIMMGTSDGYLSYCLAILYRRFKIRDWNNKLPDVSSLKHKEFLWGENDTYIIFHRQHKKFGKAIVESGQNMTKNSFVFFDYSILKPVFHALDDDLPLPCVPTYYALPEDRDDYEQWRHEWE